MQARPAGGAARCQGGAQQGEGPWRSCACTVPPLPSALIVPPHRTTPHQPFLVCPGPRAQQCADAFRWVEEKSVRAAPAPPVRDEAQLQRELRARGLPYYAKCELIKVGGGKRRPPVRGGGRGRKRRRRGAAGSDESSGSEGEGGGGSNGSQRPVTYYLKLRAADREKSAAYSRNDLWALFVGPLAGKGASDALVVRSVFHGPSRADMMEVRAVTPLQWPTFPLKRRLEVHALNALNAGTEVAVLEALEGRVAGATARDMPLLRPLLQGCPDAKPPSPLPALPGEAVDAEVTRAAEQFGLNDDQRGVLVRCADWLRARPSSEAAAAEAAATRSPIALVHGVFGAGKSHLLVAIASCLARLVAALPAAEQTRCRILVAGVTNVAVDRVLMVRPSPLGTGCPHGELCPVDMPCAQGLQEAGCDDYARVGSLRKIARTILPRVLHSTDRGDAQREVMEELLRMLREARQQRGAARGGDETAGDEQYITTAIEELRAGKVGAAGLRHRVCLSLCLRGWCVVVKGAPIGVYSWRRGLAGKPRLRPSATPPSPVPMLSG